MYGLRAAHTIEEAAEILRVSRRTMQRWIASGEIRCVRIGGRTIVSGPEIARVLGLDHGPSSVDPTTGMVGPA